MKKKKKIKAIRKCERGKHVHTKCLVYDDVKFAIYHVVEIIF